MMTALAATALVATARKATTTAAATSTAAREQTAEATTVAATAAATPTATAAAATVPTGVGGARNGQHSNHQSNPMKTHFPNLHSRTRSPANDVAKWRTTDHWPRLDKDRSRAAHGKRRRVSRPIVPVSTMRPVLRAIKRGVAGATPQIPAALASFKQPVREPPFYEPRAYAVPNGKWRP